MASGAAHRKPCGSKGSNPAFARLLECAGHAMWRDDRMVLDVAAYVMNASTFETKPAELP